MREEQWTRFKQAALRKNKDWVIALIVDSPWIPGFVGISHLDYYLFPDLWLEANLDVLKRFPDVIFIPGFWIEYGMAAEPSGFGCRIAWYDSQPPTIYPVVNGIRDLKRLKAPNPKRDGLMPFILRLYAWAEQQLKNTQFKIRMVAARGPLAIASWVYGVTNLLVDIKRFPNEIKQFIELTTDTTIEWLKAQIEVLSEVEGIIVLDDIAGLLSPADYKEFAHPYLKAIFSEFNAFIKVYHNDSNTSGILNDLVDLNFDIFNFSYQVDISVAKEKIGDKVVLMGNIDPLNIIARGTPDIVAQSVKECMAKVDNKPQGIIISAGGGVSPGTPAENINSLVQILRGI